MKTHRYGYLYFISGLLVIVGTLALMIFTIPDDGRDIKDSGDAITVVSVPTGPAHLHEGQSAVRRSDAMALAEKENVSNVMGSDATRTPPDPTVETALDREAQNDIVDARNRALERQSSSGRNGSAGQ